MADKIYIVQYARARAGAIARNKEVYRSKILAMLDRVRHTILTAEIVTRPDDIADVSSVVMLDMMGANKNAPLVFVIDREADDAEVFTDRDPGMIDE